MTLGTFSVCVFAWHGLESCCCSGVSEPASKGLAPIVLGVLEGASSNGLVVFSLMDSKGDVRHFFGVRFAWHGLESCCCLGVSEPASKGLAPIVLGVLEGASSNGLVFSLMDSKGDVRHFFGVHFCMAWARILLLFGCFATGLQRTCANRFGCFGRGVVQWLVFSLMDSKGDVRHFFGVRFCMAWARILLLFGCLTGLQRTCANRFGCFGRGVVQWLGIFFNGFQR